MGDSDRLIVNCLHSIGRLIMAERLNKRQADSVRSHIQSTKIIQELQKGFDGEREITKIELDIARLLLDKSVPSLKSAEIDIAGDGLTVVVRKYGD